MSIETKESIQIEALDLDSSNTSEKEGQTCSAKQQVFLFILFECQSKNNNMLTETHVNLGSVYSPGLRFTNLYYYIFSIVDFLIEIYMGKTIIIKIFNTKFN